MTRRSRNEQPDLALPPEVDWSHGLALLDSYITDSIAAHPRPIRKRLRALVDAGLYLVSTRFHIGDDDRPIPFSLTYVVQVPCTPDEDGDRVTLCTVHWSRLELTPDHVYRELAVTLRQHAAGDPLVTVDRTDDPPPDPSPRAEA
jgi:hypothetical protein